MTRVWRVSLIVAGLACGVSGRAVAARDDALRVPAGRAWTDTGLDLQSGEPLHIEATGTARMVRVRALDWFFGTQTDRIVWPPGTYLWPSSYVQRRRFPLPAMADGPFPAFCLIGKLGDDGPPFYVGARYDGVAERAGRLWLGINDDHLADNRGAFAVRISPRRIPSPPRASPLIEPGSRAGRPIPDARVLLLYVDGLRPDVMREMAQAGFLPHLARTFLEGGVAVPEAFTVFPSNTLIANGALFTGGFSDRTGIKSQHQFERSTLTPKGQLSEWLPDGWIRKPQTRVLNLLDKYAPENTHAFLVKRGIPTLATRLGNAYRWTTLPIAPLNPPPQWLHRAANTLGPFGLAHRLPLRLDVVNAHYAAEELIGDPEARVIAVWLPMVDKTSHHSPRGQFGAARRDLAVVDRLLGLLLARLKEVRWDRSTYLVLVSDHGHLGGEASVNRVCNLPRDWAARHLGCNAGVVGQSWTHPGLNPSRVVFFDNQGAGQAKLFLPYGSYLDGPWRRNRLFELTHYALRPGQPRVNLLESLAAFRPPGWQPVDGAPVDLLLVKLDERRTLVWRSATNQAIISRDHEISGREVFWYEPVQRLSQSEDGALRHEPPSPGVDPLGYLQDDAVLSVIGGASWLAAPHTAREWLQATAQSRYPDAVVTMATFFAWGPAVSDLAEARDPDLVVTASAGWSFRSDDGAGTDHGYPLADAMRISLFLAGPRIAPGVLREPHRIVDILPTLLEMVRWSYDPAALDGVAIRGIYE
ncbi:MAG: alkaline phosphatase family protein [Candidatus Omnitrophota bacterium]|nr:alkaline phosphatase family protein [Candidatus Omnitrophota bacterium]